MPRSGGGGGVAGGRGEKSQGKRRCYPEKILRMFFPEKVEIEFG